MMKVTTIWAVLLLSSVLLIAQAKKPPKQSITFDHDLGIAVSPITLDETPQPRVAIGGTYIIEVDDKDNKLMVRVTQDGKVTYGDGYKPDAAARTFWEVMAKYYSSVCNKEMMK